MKVFLFHLMPYSYLDLDYTDKYNSCWVVLPNSYFDETKGMELYHRYLDELELGDQLGFDGVCVNEHHQNAYGLMPSPVVIAAALSRRTEQAKIAILGSAFGLRDNPLTLAEEHAMLDHLTKGRIITGMVRGVGAEYYSSGANPAYSHARFQEAHDLVVQSWTKPGPFEFEGSHYHFRYVNVWPRPVQKPHPPIWCPSQGSRETILWAAHPDRKYTYLHTYSPIGVAKRYMDMYREIAEEEYGYTSKPDQLGWAVLSYVAETDEIAYREAKEHIEAFFNKFLNLPFEMLFPPGYLTPASMKSVSSNKKHLSEEKTIDFLIENGMFACGSPETVRQILEERQKQLGFENILPMLQFGTLPKDLTRKNIEMFGREVMPHLQRTSAPKQTAEVSVA